MISLSLTDCVFDFQGGSSDDLRRRHDGLPVGRRCVSGEQSVRFSILRAVTKGEGVLETA